MSLEMISLNASDSILEENYTLDTKFEEVEVVTIPEEVYFTYYGFVVFGCFINLTIFCRLLICKRNGVLSLVLQLALVDAISGYVAILEIWSKKNDSWSAPGDLCPIFAGSEVLTNTLIIYLIISFNFHVVSLINLQFSELHKGNKNPLTRCNEDDSNECLVRKSESSSRNVTIDYRKRKTEVSVLVPSILIWFISISLSLPEYTLASTIKLQNDTLCTIVDSYYGQLLQKLLLIFRVLIPEPLLFMSLVLLIVNLYKIKSKQQLENIFVKNVQSLLIFTIVLTLFYFCTSLQRDTFYLQHTLGQEVRNGTMDGFKRPPFHNDFLTNMTGTLLSMWHYSAILFRPLLYLYFLSSFREALRENIPCVESAEKN